MKLSLSPGPVVLGCLLPSSRCAGVLRPFTFSFLLAGFSLRCALFHKLPFVYVMDSAEAVFGPILLGVFGDVLLYGMLLMQTYIYTSSPRCKQDPKWMRMFVGSLILLNTVKSAIDMGFVYTRLTQNFGNFPAMMVTNWLLEAEFGMTAIIAYMVQLFFAWRIFRLTSNFLVTLIIVLCSTIQMLAGFATAAAGTFVKELGTFHTQPEVVAVVVLWLAFATLADVTIAGSLVLFLRRETGASVSPNGPSKAADPVVDRIARLAVGTGGLTAAFAAADLVVFLTSASTLHLFFSFPLAKLYANSLLFSLNARAGLREAAAAGIASGGSPTVPVFSGARDDKESALDFGDGRWDAQAPRAPAGEMPAIVGSVSAGWRSP